MLKDIIDNNLLEAKAVYGIFEANSNDQDDIDLFVDGVKFNTFHTLRQQAESEADTAYVAMSDFIAPVSAGYKDYIVILYSLTLYLGLLCFNCRN